MTDLELQARGFVRMPDGSYRKPSGRTVRFIHPQTPSEPKSSPEAILGANSASPEDRLNKTEKRWLAILRSRNYSPIWCQAITLALDPPFRSYRPDMAYLRDGRLTFVEVKGPHRFRRAGITKTALAAKTYPQFRFEIAEWFNGAWKEMALDSSR